MIFMKKIVIYKISEKRKSYYFNIYIKVFLIFNNLKFLKIYKIKILKFYFNWIEF